MSLINQMLQDLESRKNAQAEAENKKTVYEDLKPVRASGWRAPSRRVTVLALAIVLIGAGAYAWVQWGDRLFSGEEPATAKPRPAVARQAPVKPVQTPAPVAEAVAATSPAPSAPVDKASSEPAVASAKKEEAGATPKPEPAVKEEAKPQAESSATSTQTAAPAKSKPANAAEKGYWTVSRGETLYSISAKTGIDLWDLSAWNRLEPEHVIRPGQRLRLTAPASAETKPQDKKAEKKGPARQEKAAAATAKPSPAEDATPAPAANDGRENAVVDKKMKPLSAEERAEGEYRQAVTLLQQGRAADAERRLRTALDADAAHVGARELLAGLALQNGRWREAQQILEQGLAKAPERYSLAQLLARVYVEHGADQKALAAMEASRQAAAGNADFVAFLAALYQRAGKHAEAVKAYTEAVTLNPQEGQWWLGMGISLEAGQDRNAAATAYQRAIDSGTLDDKLRQYAQQRLAVVKNK